MNWKESKGNMEIISVTPRGYCQGVVRAIRIAKETVEKNPGVPVTMLGMIVHNRHVVEECRRLGIICLEDPGKTRLELLDEVNEGIVIFTAHGVSDSVMAKAKAKGLTVVDATCKDVAGTHDLVRRHCEHGDVLYIGKKHHPEAEGVEGLSPRVHLISCKEDIDALPDGLSDILITNQTTLSILDAKALIEACLKVYPDAKVAPEICHATTIRQEAVRKLKDVDVLIVVGDPHSNNSNQLRQIGLAGGIPQAYLIEDSSQLREEMVVNKKRIAVTSGSSTPTALTSEVIHTLEHYAKTGEFTLPVHQEVL